MENNKSKKRGRIGLYAMWMALGIVVAGAAGYGIAAAATKSSPGVDEPHKIELVQDQTSGFKIECDKTEAKRGDVVTFTVKANGNDAKIPSAIRISSTKTGEEAVFAEYPLEKNGTDYKVQVTITINSNMKAELRLQQCFIVTLDQNEPGKSTTTKTTINVVSGQAIAKPLDPAVENYDFKGWSETIGGALFDFTTPITKDTTLYANWTQTPLVTKIELDKQLISFDVDTSVKTQTLTATITSGLGADTTLIWSSSNSSIATVTQTSNTTATVTKAANAVGSCLITVTSAKNPSISACCTVSVTDELLTFWVHGSVTSECVVEVTPGKQDKIKGHLAIPESATIDGKLYPVRATADSAFANCTELTSLFIPKTLTEVVAGFTKGCTKLESITVDEQNSYCSSIDGVLFCNDQKYLAAFPANKKATTSYYQVPSTVTEIESYAFCDVQNFTGIHLPSGVEVLKHNWLHKTDGVTSKLSELTFENSDGNWYYTPETTPQQIKISKTDPKTTFNNFKNIDYRADLGATELKGFDFQVLDETAKTCQVWGDGSTVPESGEVIIPEYITVKDEQNNTFKSYKVVQLWSSWTFSDCSSNLSSITLPKTITKIPYCAFCYCDLLQTVNLPDTIEIIDQYAFYGCYRLNEINSPDSIKSIKAYAFSGCSALPNTTTLPQYLVELGDGAFYNCSNAFTSTLKLPSTLQTIGRNPFAGCTNITKFTITNSSYFWTNSAGLLFNSNGTDLIAVPAGTDVGTLDLSLYNYITKIGNDAFNGCGLYELILPNNLQYLEPYTFEYLTTGKISISEVNNYYSIGTDGCLYNKEKTILYSILSSVVDFAIPSTVVEIASGAGYGLNNLKTLDFTNASSLKKIGSNCFGWCESIDIIDFTGATSLETIERNAFSYCVNLSTVKLVSNIQKCYGFQNINYYGIIPNVYCDSSYIANTFPDEISSYRSLLYCVDTVFVKAGINVLNNSYLYQNFNKAEDPQSGYYRWNRK